LLGDSLGIQRHQPATKTASMDCSRRNSPLGARQTRKRASKKRSAIVPLELREHASDLPVRVWRIFQHLGSPCFWYSRPLTHKPTHESRPMSARPETLPRPRAGISWRLVVCRCYSRPSWCWRRLRNRAQGGPPAAKDAVPELKTTTELERLGRCARNGVPSISRGDQAINRDGMKPAIGDHSRLAGSTGESGPFAWDDLPAVDQARSIKAPSPTR